MSRDMLSQEEIDALLRMNSEQTQADAVNQVDQYLSSLEIDALGEIGNISFGSASTALSTLLRQKVDITTPEVSVVSRADLEKEFPQPHVAVHVQYTEGFRGISLLVIKTTDARIIADLMLGGDGTNPAELGEMEISACQEAMNQMMGSAATSMSTIFNQVINISPPGVDIIDLSKDQHNDLIEEELFVKVSFTLRIGNLVDSQIMQLIPISFAKHMVEKLMGGLNGEEQQVKETSHEPVQQKVEQSIREPQQMRSNPVPNARQEFPDSRPAYSYSTNSPQMIGGPGNVNRTASVQPIQFSHFENFQQYSPQNENNLNLLLDIPLQVTVELGRTKKLIKEILELAPGSIIELEKLAGEPVDILVNNKLIAKGEVVVIEENFGVRVTDIVSPWERLQKLQ